MQLANLEDLKLDFFVRTALNEDRVIQMAMKYESDGLNSLPPIVVTDDFRIVDGRHRFEALKLNNTKQAPVEITVETDPAKLIMMAAGANMGGSLPPQSIDIELAVKQLLNKGTKREEILNWLKPKIGIKAARQSVDWAQSHLAKSRIVQALNAITQDGLTLAQAAQKYNVNVGTLQDAMIGKTKKVSRGVQARNEFQNKQKSLNLSVGQIFRKLMDDMTEGNADPLEVRKFVDDIKAHGDYHRNKAEEMYNRLDKMI